MEQKFKRDSYLIIRVTKLEKAYLIDKAESSYLNLTDYARGRLFEDADSNDKRVSCELFANKARFACDQDKELINLSLELICIAENCLSLSVVKSFTKYVTT